MQRTKVVSQFLAMTHKEGGQPFGPIWFQGSSLYSYKTEIARITGDGLAINPTRYSPTTSKGQGEVTKQNREAETPRPVVCLSSPYVLA